MFFIDVNTGAQVGRTVEMVFLRLRFPSPYVSAANLPCLFGKIFGCKMTGKAFLGRLVGLTYGTITCVLL